ncbi:uncharacterized protein [Panulirus ornatus]|uniref:uncharacterized protein isoform X2 n=1 Tax=Panulirus ornatus TaxID=150431 RepID=UPI003A8B678C
MSWFGSASEWKQGLSSGALSKVEELENQVERLKREKTQKQNQLDTLQQALDNQKRKTDDSIKEKQALEKEIEQLGRNCEQLHQQLQRVQHDHVSSSITLLPPRQTTVMDSHASQSGEEMDNLRKKLEELTRENKDLQAKLSEQSVPRQGVDIAASSSFSVAIENDRDFWGSFGEKSNKRSQRTPSKTPVKKALETSEENPFKAPYLAPHGSKGLGISEGNAFRTSSCQLQLPTASCVVGPTDEYTKKLERIVEQYKKDIEGLQVSSSVPHDISKLHQEVASLKIALDKTNAELAAREKALKASDEQLSSFKSTAEEMAGKLEKTEQRLRAVQSELDCQRHNSEAVRKNLEEKLKEREKELNSDITQAQNDMAGMERQIRDLQTKLQQQETVTRNTQNSLQASLDKAVAQTASVEKDCKAAVSRSNQLETEVTKLVKAAEDSAKTLNHLRQEKEMIAAETSGLKVKLKAAESLTENLTNRLELAEQLAENRKLALEQLQSEKDKAVKDAENSTTKLTQEMSKLQEELKAVEAQKNEAQEAIISTNKECDRKLAGINAMEAEVCDMQAQVAKTNAEMENLKSDTASSLEKAKADASAEVERIKEETKKQVDNVKLMAEEEVAKMKECAALEMEKVKGEAVESVKLKDRETHTQLEHMKEQISEAERRAKVAEDIASEAQKNEEMAHGEKLAAELFSWELEGTIDSLKAEAVQHHEVTDALKSEIEAVVKDKVEREKHLEEEIKEKEKMIQGVSSALDAKQKSIMDFETKCQSIEARLEALTEEKEQVETHSKDVQKKLAANIADLTKVLEERELLLSESHREIEGLNSQLVSTQAEKMELADQLDKLNTKTEEAFKDMQIALEESSCALEVKQQHLLDTEKKYEDMKNENEMLLELKNQMEMKTGEAEKQHSERITNLNQTLEKYKLSLEESQSIVENLSTQLETLMAENKKLGENSERIKAENEERLSIVQSALEVADNHSCELKGQVEMLRTQVDHLDSTFENKTEALMQEKIKLEQVHEDLKLALENLNRECQEKHRKLMEAEQEVYLLKMGIEERCKDYEQITLELSEKEKLVKDKEIELGNSISREKQLEKLVAEVDSNLKASENQCGILKNSIEEKEDQLSRRIRDSQVLTEELDNLKKKLEAANDEIHEVKEDGIRFQASLEELEDEKNNVISCLQEQISHLTKEKEGLLQRLCKEEEKSENALRTHHQTQMQLTNLLNERSSQLAELKLHLKEIMSVIDELKKLYSSTPEKDPSEEEQCSCRSTLDNLKVTKNMLALEMESLRCLNKSLSERLESLMEAYTALQSSKMEIETANEQLVSSLNERSKELEKLVVSQNLIQEQKQQQALQAEEGNAVFTQECTSSQMDVELKERERESLVKQHILSSQEHEEAKEQLDSAVRAMKTTKDRMVDTDVYLKVCKENEFLREQVANHQDEMIKITYENGLLQEQLRISEDITEKNEINLRSLENRIGELSLEFNGHIRIVTLTVSSLNVRLKAEEEKNNVLQKNADCLRQDLKEMISKFDHEHKKAENIKRDFDNYRDVIMMMGRQQDHTTNSKVAQIQKENEDLIVRLKHVEKNNGQLLRTLRSLRKREAKLTSQLQAAIEDSEKEKHSTIPTEGVGVPVSHQTCSEELQTTLKPCETSSVTSDIVENMTMQLRDAETTVSTLQHQLNVATEKLELLRTDKEMETEKCSRLTGELSTKELEFAAQKMQLQDLEAKVACKESLVLEMEENIRNLNEAMKSLENHNCSLMTQVKDYNTELVVLKSSGEYKAAQNQLETLTSLEDQLKNEANEAKERLNQAMYDLKRAQDQNKLNRDIAEELEERVTSLETELRISSESRDKLQEEMKRLRSSSGALQGNSCAEQQPEISSGVVTGLQKECDNLQEKNNCLKEQLGKMMEKQENINLEFEDSHSRREELAFLNEELSSKNDELTTKNDLLIFKNEELTTMIDDLKVELNELMCQNNILKSNAEMNGKKEAELLIQIQDHMAYKQELENQVHTASQRLEEVISGNKELIARNTEVVLQNETLIAENKSLQVSLKEHSLNLEELEELREVKNIENEKGIFEKQCKDLEATDTDGTQSKNELGTEKEQLLDSLKEPENTCSQSQVKYIEALEGGKRDALTFVSELMPCEQNEQFGSSQEITESYDTILTERDQILEENAGLHSEREELLVEREKILNDKLELLSEKEKLQSKIEQMEKEKDELMSEKVFLVSQKEDLEVEKDSALNDIETLLSEKKKHESEIEELEKEKDNLISENKVLVKQKEDLQAEKSSIFNDLENVLSEKKELQSEKEQLLKKNSDLLSEIEVLGIDKEALSAEKYVLLCDKQQVFIEKEQLQSKSEDLVSEKELMQAEFLSIKEKLESEMEKMKIEKDELMAVNEVLVKQNADLQSQENLAYNDNVIILSEKKDLQLEKEKILKEKNELLSEKEALGIEKETLFGEKQQLVVDNERILQENTTLLSEKKVLTRETDQLKKNVEDLVLQNTLFALEKEKLLGETEDLKAEKGQWEFTNDRILLENKSLLSEKEVLLKEKDNLTKNVEDLVSENTLFASEKENLKAEVEGLRVEKEQMIVELQQQKSALELHEMDIEDLHENIQNLTSLRESLISEKDQLARINEQLQKENEVLAEKVTVIDFKDDEIMKLSTQITQHVATEEQLTSEVMHLKSEINDLQAEKEQLVLDLENARTHLKLAEDENETQKNILENQGGKIETLQSTIDDLRKQLHIMENEAVILKNNVVEKTEEAVKLINELTKVKESLRVSQDNFANKLSEVDMAILKDKIASGASGEESLARKEGKIKELDNLVKESRKDLEALRAKFSLNQKIGRKKEEELQQALKHIEEMETEIKQLKEKVKVTEEESSSHFKQLQEVTKELNHWQKRFDDKNAEAEELAAKHIEVLKKLLDLEEENDNLKSKVILLQTQIKRYKMDISKSACHVEASKLEKEVKTSSDAATSERHDLQGSDSQEIVVSSQIEVPQVPRCARTRRAPVLSVTTVTESLTTEVSAKGLQRSRRSRRSQATSLEGKSEAHSVSDNTMKQALKRASSSTSVLKDKRTRQLDVTVIPESPASAESLPSKVKQGLNDIPSDVECPGAIQRTAVLSKMIDAEEKLQEGGPLKSLSTNSPVRRSKRHTRSHRNANTGSRTQVPNSVSRGEECKTQ